MFWESQSSTFWFQLLWGLLDGVQHAVNFFQQVGLLVSAKELKNMAIYIYIYTYSPWGGAKGSWLYFMATILFCLAWLLSFVHVLFSLLWLNLLYGTQGKPRRLKLFYKQEVGSTRHLSPGRAYRILVFHHDQPQNCLFNNSMFI